MQGRDKMLTPRAIEAMIAEGKAITIYEGRVLRLDSWLDRHPGGRLAILHMVGRDATDEINAYHSATTLQTMGAYQIGRTPVGYYMNKTPPIRGGVYLREFPEEAIGAGANEGDGGDGDAPTDDDTASLRSIRTTGTLTSATTLTSDSSLDDDSYKTANPDTGVCRRRHLPGKKHAAATTSLDNPASSPTESTGLDLTPAEYTEWAVQQDIDQDRLEYPSLDPVVQQDITRRYRVLHQQIRDEGLYECPYAEYGKEMVRYLTLFAAFTTFLHYGWYMTAAVFLGLFWHQIMFTAHDAGHRAITHNFVVDTLIGIFIADFCCGLSIGWWKSSHNVHHLVTNQPEHDPDIQNVPLFATSPAFFKSISSTYYDGFVFYWDAAANFLVPYQKYTYYPIMGIARFNLYLLSWLHVLSSKSSGLGGSRAWWVRPTELSCMAGYWFLFGYCLLWCTLPTWPVRIAFVLVSHIITMPLHVQITLSHWAMSTTNLGESESFPQRQLRTTMDVSCPAWLDFIHGGLQFQAVHHLFPRVPRHNLRRVQVLVRELCEDTGIPYSILGFVDGNRKVLGKLGEVGEQVKILIDCQKYMAETGESGLH